jgi:chaperonin GroEL (HSP60 family)
MSVFLSEEIFNAVDHVLNHTKNILKIENNSLLHNEKNRMLVKTSMQTCINHKFNDDLYNEIYKILIDHCFKAESISPGGFVATIDNITNINTNQNFDKEDCVSFSPCFSDLKNLIANICKNEILANLILEALNLAGFAGRISIEKSSNSSTSVELIEGYTFKHSNLLLNLKPVRLVKPKVVCIDGYIESISEINLLLEGAAESKHQLLLIARGMHNDVITTAKINRDRSSMFLYPIIINFDIDGINTLVDICKVSGSLPFSSNLGNLISSIKISDAVQIDEATIVKDSLILKNKSTKNEVNLHISDIIERRNSNVKSEDIFNARIKSLSGNNVIIRLPDDSNYVLHSQMIDYVLRSIRSALDFGITIKENNVSLFATNKASKVYSKKFLEQIRNVGAALC